MAVLLVADGSASLNESVSPAAIETVWLLSVQLCWVPAVVPTVPVVQVRADAVGVTVLCPCISVMVAAPVVGPAVETIEPTASWLTVQASGDTTTLPFVKLRAVLPLVLAECSEGK